MTRKLVLSAAVFTMAALIQTACSDLVESSYSSMVDAKRAGAVDRGWLPPFVPEGARGIREIHNVDTNETWCVFELPTEEVVSLRGALSVVTPNEVSSRRVRRPGVSWWPEVLAGALDLKAIEGAGLELYKSGFILVAIDKQRGRAFFYRERA